MKFVLVLAFVAYGHTYHKEVPYPTMNECINAKQLIIKEFKSRSEYKLLSATCQSASVKEPPK